MHARGNSGAPGPKGTPGPKAAGRPLLPVPSFLANLPEPWVIAFCLLAILAAVSLSFRPSGLFGDDEQYLYLVKGFFIHRPFENLHDGDGSFFLLRPLGYPIFLSLFYPLFGQHWELYPWITAMFSFGLGVITFFCFKIRMGNGASLAFTLAMLCNPIIRLWSTNAYSDIPFTFFMVLFMYLFATKRWLDALPFLALFMVAMRTSGLPLAGAYGVALVVRKEYRRLAILSGALLVYFGVQQWYFGEVPGLQEYFRIHVQDSVNTETVPLMSRMMHNLRSLLFTLLSSTFFYGGYGLLQASLLKSVLCLMAAGLALFCLAVAAGRSVFYNLLILGYFLVMLVLRPEDLVNRLLIPLIPLVYLGAGRLAGVAATLYMPRLRQAVIAVALLSALDGVLSMGIYRKEFHPRDYSAVYHAGETAPGLESGPGLTGSTLPPRSP
ncbi:MAG: hypothetical protein JWP91_232 [Fibrobacteres bacterium]|nr:hypothetical protein [Fibrobacterota bacterium]